MLSLYRRAIFRLRFIASDPHHPQVVGSVRRASEGVRDGLYHHLSDDALAHAHGAHWAADDTLREIRKAGL